MITSGYPVIHDQSGRMATYTGLSKIGLLADWDTLAGQFFGGLESFRESKEL